MPHPTEQPAEHLTEPRPTEPGRTEPAARPPLFDPYREGEEPDPRFTLANERTFLAWQRTALALTAGGIGIAALTTHTPARQALATVLVLLGIATAVTALRRWSATEHALRVRRPLPRLRAGRFLPFAIAGLALLATALLILPTP
ncbi:YidH family protein [Streptomyces celluloflavus]|uniref:YidH family protein n=1 Tax=Streptomyces celluloflavus TaxID=58344 RepID=UPI00364A08A5